MMDAQDFRREIGKFLPVFFQEKEVGQYIFRPLFTGGKGTDARRIGEDIFQGNMAFGIFQGNFFPVSFDEIFVGPFGGKGTGREILLTEEVLLQLSGMVREKEIMEPAAVVLKPSPGRALTEGMNRSMGQFWK